MNNKLPNVLKYDGHCLFSHFDRKQKSTKIDFEFRN